MELDDVDRLPKAPSRTTKFAPGRGPKPKPKPKPPATAKQEPPELIVKVEGSQFNPSIPKTKENEDVDGSCPFTVHNGAVKMEIDAQASGVPETKHHELTVEPADKEPVTRQDEPMAEPDEEEEADEIVREIDVIFHPSIEANAKLYLWQFPLRPNWRPFEMDERCQEVRMKPSTSEVEVDLSMDMNSENYDTENGSMLNMEKQTFATMWTPLGASSYAVGQLKGDKLHLNPVHAVVQLRPSMEHLSTGKRKNQTKATAEDTAKPQKSNVGSVSSSKKLNKGVESSTEKGVVREEGWVQIKYRGHLSDFSSRYKNKMSAQESSPIEFTMTPYDYINSLCPGGSNKNLKPKGPSRRDLLSLPMEERFKKFFVQEPSFHRFSVLKHFAPEASNDDVLEVLQKHALLIQGLWTPKTKLLELDSQAAYARDYVLVLFSKALEITAAQVNATGRNKDRVKAILSTLATERSLLEDWKFKGQADVQFIKEYPKIVKSQEEGLKTMEAAIMSLLQRTLANKKNVKGRPEVASRTEMTISSDKVLTKARVLPDEIRNALPNALKKVFQHHKVCSFQLITQGLRDLNILKSIDGKAVSSTELFAALGVDGPSDELQEIISQIATNIYGFYVLKSSPDHPDYDPLREVVIRLLCARPDAKLKKADIFTAAKIQLGREITNSEYNKVMSDFCETIGSAWILRKPK